jgi:hypothetical protein
LLLFLPFSNDDDEDDEAVDGLLLPSSSEYALIVQLELPPRDEEEKEISDGSASSVLFFVLFRSVSYANERDDRLDSVNRFVDVEIVEANIANGDVHADAS